MLMKGKPIGTNSAKPMEFFWWRFSFLLPREAGRLVGQVLVCLLHLQLQRCLKLPSFGINISSPCGAASLQGLRGLQLGGLPCLSHGFLQIRLGLRHSATTRWLCVRSFLHPRLSIPRMVEKRWKNVQIWNTLRCIGINQPTIRAKTLVDNVESRKKGTFCNAQGLCVRRSLAPEAINLPYDRIKGEKM